MRSTRRRPWLASLLLIACAPACAVDDPTDTTEHALADDTIDVTPDLTTPALHRWKGSPRAPDADDPAIWVPSRGHHAPLVIATLKDGGLAVYDLDGALVQALPVANRPAVGAADPTVLGPQPDAATAACPDSASGKTFGRYNNIEIAPGFPLRRADGRVRDVDLAVVTDRGCDRLRFFAIDPDAPDGPLVDVTAADAPRVFPERFVQPSPVQSPGLAARTEANPLDDQSTAYGLAVYARGHRFHAAITQRSRSAVALVELASDGGRVSYRRRAELRFDPVFRVGTPAGAVDWTPCREEASDDPQLEGLLYDQDRDLLWAAQEDVGVWAIPMAVEPRGVVSVRQRHLVERVRSFGAPWWAVPDGDENACVGAAPSPLPDGTVAAPGDAAAGGAYVEADAEGIALDRGRGLLIVSSQGSSTFQVYAPRWNGSLAGRHVGAFRLDGVSDTDDLDLVTAAPRVTDSNGAAASAAPIAGFPGGLLVTQNGGAPPPASTGKINGYKYAGSTQLAYVDWASILARL